MLGALMGVVCVLFAGLLIAMCWDVERRARKWEEEAKHEAEMREQEKGVGL